jgi:hypothetical protein
MAAKIDRLTERGRLFLMIFCIGPMRLALKELE